MQSVYTIFYNTGNDVSHLRYCNGYTHAEELMEEVVGDFMKINYTGLPRKICKYMDDANTFSAKLYADATFPNGLVFVQKKYEATIYEKTAIVGTFRTSYDVQYIGRFGVLSQQQTMSEHQVQLLDSMRIQVSHKDQLLNQQEQLIRRQEMEIERLDGQCGKLDANKEQMILRLEVEIQRMVEQCSTLNAEITQLQEDKYYGPVGSAVAAATPTKVPKTILIKQNEAIAPILDELKNAFASNTFLLKPKSARKAIIKPSQKTTPKKVANDDAAIDIMIKEIEDIYTN